MGNREANRSVLRFVFLSTYVQPTPLRKGTTWLNGRARLRCGTVTHLKQRMGEWESRSGTKWPDSVDRFSSQLKELWLPTERRIGNSELRAPAPSTTTTVMPAPRIRARDV